MSRAWPSGRRARSPRDIARRRRRRRGALRRPGRAAPTRAAGGQGGRCHERGLRAGGPDRRGIWRRRAAAWCSSTPGASGSDPRRWRSRRAMSRAWPSGRRARSPRDMASQRRRRRGALRRPGRAAPTRAAGGQGGRCHERGLRAGGQDRRGIWRRGVGGGVVLFDARGERLRPAPLEVKEGEVTSVAFGPEGKIAAGYDASASAAAWCSSTPGASGSDPRRWRSRRAMSGAWPSGRRARSPRDMASAASAAAAWCSSTPGASGSDPRRWRSRRAMSRAWPSGRRARSPRDMAASASAAAAWCSSTPGASGSDPRRWRSRRALSRAWPSGRRARSPRDMRRRRRRRGALRRPGRAAPTRAAGGQGGRCQERGLRAGGQDRRGI